MLGIGTRAMTKAQGDSLPDARGSGPFAAAAFRLLPVTLSGTSVSLLQSEDL